MNNFKSQIEYFKYDILSDELGSNTFGPVENRTKEGILNITDEYEITDLEYWPPLSPVGDDNPFNSMLKL